MTIDPVSSDAPRSRGSASPQVVELLMSGAMGACSLIPEGSNSTFYATLSDGAGWECRAVYKPRRGETPLWDFPQGTLYRREYAAYLLSEALGWRFVPPTVIRDGVYGIGAVQLYVDSDPQAHYFNLRQRYRDEMMRMCAFDVIANNADRKASHCLLGTDGCIWAIDHGITFHSQPKLRTVIWDFAGQPLPQGIASDVQRLRDRFSDAGGLGEQLSGLLSSEEVSAVAQRLAALLEAGVFPPPGPGRAVPWPWI